MPYDKIIGAILLFIVMAFGGYLIYDKIYDYGYSQAESKYTKIIDKYNKDQETKVNNIQSSINSLISATTNYNNVLLSDMTKIQSSIANKALIVYKDGKCELSPDYIQARAAAIDRANKK